MKSQYHSSPGSYDCDDRVPARHVVGGGVLHRVRCRNSRRARTGRSGAGAPTTPRTPRTRRSRDRWERRWDRCRWSCRQPTTPGPDVSRGATRLGMTRSDYFTVVRPAPTIATGASAGRHRLSRAARSAPMGKPSFAGRSFVGGFSRLNRRRPWHRLPLPVALVNLIALRVELRQHNLTDTRTPGPERAPRGRHPRPVPAPGRQVPDGRRLVQRPGRPGHGDGRHPVRPQRGRSTRRAPEPMPGLMEPNPHTISRTLMRREHLHAGHVAEPAGGRLDPVPDPRLVRPRPRPGARLRDPAFPTGTPGTRTRCGCPHTLRGPHADRRRQGPAADLHQPAVALVGRLERSTAAPRSSSDAVRTFTDGKLCCRTAGCRSTPQTGTAITGFSENWWIGLGMLHTLFTLEHNAICDALKKEHPQMTRRRAVRHRPARQLRAASPRSTPSSGRRRSSPTPR